MDHAPVVDGHNDTLLALADADDRVATFREGGGEGHLDLPRARSAGLGAAFFAAFVPNETRVEKRETPDGVEYPVPDPLDRDRAKRVTYETLECLHQWAAEIDGFRVLRTLEDLDRCLERGEDAPASAGTGEGDRPLGAIFHLEGAEAIEPDLSNLEFLYRSGLRSVGPVWSRHNEFGHGVRFEYPGHPDTGPGFTETGLALLDACEDRGILVDLAHATERGFFDAAEAQDGPLVVSHTGAHALCEHSRNLTDRQLDAVADSGGIVGIAFAEGTLAGPDGDAGVDTIADHVEYVADRAGIDHVGLGSDFDGASVPDDVGDVTGLPAVFAELRDRGFDADRLAKVARGNWRRVIAEVWT